MLALLFTSCSYFNKRALFCTLNHYISRKSPCQAQKIKKITSCRIFTFFTQQPDTCCQAAYECDSSVDFCFAKRILMQKSTVTAHKVGSNIFHIWCFIIHFILQQLRLRFRKPLLFLLAYQFHLLQKKFRYCGISSYLYQLG